MTSGHFDESLKIAHDQYQFKSLDSPGLLPLGIIIDEQRYQLLTKPHSGVCDNKACQREAKKKISKNKKFIGLYEESPLYSNLGNHEICICCAQLSIRQTYEPTINESRQILEILGYDPDESSSNDCGCESDDCNCESDDCNCESDDYNCETDDCNCETDDCNCETDNCESDDCESNGNTHVGYELIKEVEQMII
jgi:hypothetical protein